FFLFFLPMNAVYPGSFDPITNGHVDIVNRALTIFDTIIVAVGEQEGKTPLFSVEERVQLIRESITDKRVSVKSFSGLLAEFMKAEQVEVAVRSLRAVSDFDYEFQMALTNRTLHPSLETAFLMTSKEWLFLSSSLVKELAKNKADLSSLVPSCVEHALSKKFPA
ncbi:MAG: pantetheine-phosphate adenylyltransferase, partial [Nanoarchaeota archaeon]